MKLKYAPLRNFGDALNPWLWPKLLPGVFDNSGKQIWFWGIGSGLTPSKIVKLSGRHVVFGTGAGYETSRFSFGRQFPWRAYPVNSNVNNRPSTFNGNSKNFRFYCVRGPLTARLLKLNDQLAIIDPAVLIRKVSLPSVECSFKIAFMPHCRTAAFTDYSELCAELSFEYIDPRDSVETILEKIRRTRLLITEALHGAIVADAFRVPWIPVVSSDRILRFKWADYCCSVGLHYNPMRIQPLLNASRILTSGMLPPFKTIYRPAVKAIIYARAWWENKKNREDVLISLLMASASLPNLSSDENMSHAIERLDETLERFKQDLESGSLEWEE